jgi:hypothetical protein
MLSSIVLITLINLLFLHFKQNPKALFEGEGGGPATPYGKPYGLGSSAFARRYLQNLFDFFSSGYLDVSVHRVPYKVEHYLYWVSPFGYSRITVLVQLP